MHPSTWALVLMHYVIDEGFALFLGHGIPVRVSLLGHQPSFVGSIGQEGLNGGQVPTLLVLTTSLLPSRSYNLDVASTCPLP